MKDGPAYRNSRTGEVVAADDLADGVGYGVHEWEEVVVFDGDVCTHEVTSYGVCAACGTDIGD